MVYGHIKIMFALKIPAKEFYIKFLGKDSVHYEEDLVKYSEVRWMVNDNEYPDLYFGPPMCCRKDTDFVLVGVTVSIIWRRFTHCDECPRERICCNRCYGQTDHGFYDFN